MADSSHQVTVVVPPSNGGPSGQFTNVPLGPCLVERIIINFPPGCGNQVAVAIYVGGSSLYPDQAGKTFHFDSFVYLIPVSNPHANGQWKIFTANTDYNQHEIEFIFEYNYLTAATQAAAALPASL